jgi:hypothetical protein
LPQRKANGTGLFTKRRNEKRPNSPNVFSRDILPAKNAWGRSPDLTDLRFAICDLRLNKKSIFFNRKSAIENRKSPYCGATVRDFHSSSLFFAFCSRKRHPKLFRVGKEQSKQVFLFSQKKREFANLRKRQSSTSLRAMSKTPVIKAKTS